MGNLGAGLVVSASVAIGVTTIAVSLRFYVRIFMQRRFAADDYLVLFCQANFLAFMYCVIHEVKNGIGNHLFDILMNNPKGLLIGMRYWYIAQSFYIGATCTVKVAIAIFFFSLNPPNSLKITAICVAIVSVCVGVGAEVYHIFQCAPVSYFWLRFNFVSKGHCLEPHKSLILLSVFNAFDAATDLALAVLPCIMVWRMTMRKMEKFGVAILLGLGALSAISPIIRAFYFHTLLYDTTDFTYSAWPVTITSVIEPAIAITVVSITQLRPLMRKILPEKWLGNSGAAQQGTPDTPTFGGGSPRGVKRPTMGMSILQETVDEERNDHVSSVESKEDEKHRLDSVTEVRDAPR